MKFTVPLKNRVAGFAAAPARGGENVGVWTRRILFAEDGDEFAAALDSISDMFLCSPGHTVDESRISHLIVLVDNEALQAEVFVNEASLVAKASLKTAVKAGGVARLDDLADLKEVELRGIPDHPERGMIAVISAGWRRAVVYDLPAAGERRGDRDLQHLLGAAWAYLVFHARLRLRPEDWNRIIDGGWFPFIRLPYARLQEIAAHARADWPVDDLLDKVASDLKALLPSVRASILGHQLFEGHKTVFGAALDHFEREDWLSASTMIYPRLEGVMRARHADVAQGQRATQKRLAASAASDDGDSRHDWSLLMPERFETFLEKVYFANFDPKSPAGASRNTVAHGVAPESDLGMKAAVLGVLIADQLTFLWPRDSE